MHSAKGDTGGGGEFLGLSLCILHRQIASLFERLGFVGYVELDAVNTVSSRLDRGIEQRAQLIEFAYGHIHRVVHSISSADLLVGLRVKLRIGVNTEVGGLDILHIYTGGFESIHDLLGLSVVLGDRVRCCWLFSMNTDINVGNIWCHIDRAGTGDAQGALSWSRVGNDIC